LAIVALALAALAASASAAPTLIPGRTVPMGHPALYTLAPDGTFWVVRETGTSHGEVWHVGPAGEVLGESSIAISDFDPLGIGYYEGRIYISSVSIFEDQLYSWPVTSIGSSEPTHADMETEQKWGSVGFDFRINSAGVITAALGQENKIGLLNAATAFGEHPYYGQTFMGAGINNNYKPGATPFDSCESLSGPVIGEPKVCGIYPGVAPSAQWGPEGFNYPDDIAPGIEGLYVSEYFGDEYGPSLSFVFTGTGGPFVEFRFGNAGSGEGGVRQPQSMVRDGTTGDLYVSDEGNRRIDVFDGGGNFLGAFGYGVRDGADAFESCGPEAGPCQAGVSYTSDPHSLFTRLDLGPEGGLYAYEPLADQIQVFGLGGTTGSGGAGGGSGSTGTGAMPIATPPVIKPPPKPLKCKKGFVKKKVKGVAKCVKKSAHHKKHKHHKHHH
jgi:hypothetical protein